MVAEQISEDVNSCETGLQKGIKEEKRIIEELSKILPSTILITHKKTCGPDISLLDKTDLNKSCVIEVKSSWRFIYQKAKSQKNYTRSGTFYVCPHQIKEADIFAFVIKYKNKDRKTYYVLQENLRNYLKDRKPDAMRHSISIHALLEYLQPKTNPIFYLKQFFPNLFSEDSSNEPDILESMNKYQGVEQIDSI